MREFSARGCPRCPTDALRRGIDTYTLQLPENLPPTFRGRMLKLSYQFILGVCRAASNGPSSRSGATSANSSSRVMKVPIRVYCNVIGEAAVQRCALICGADALGSWQSSKTIRSALASILLENERSTE